MNELEFPKTFKQNPSITFQRTGSSSLDDATKKLLQKVDDLNKKIDVLTTVIAIGIQKEKLLEGKIQKDQIVELDKLGLSRSIIALIVGTTPLTVSVTLSNLRKEKKAKKKKQAEVGSNGNEGTSG